MWCVHTASFDSGERMANEEEKDIGPMTEQKTDRRASMLSDKTLAQLVLFSAFVGVIYFL